VAGSELRRYYHDTIDITAIHITETGEEFTGVSHFSEKLLIYMKNVDVYLPLMSEN
jgi:hypothetical protein